MILFGFKMGGNRPLEQVSSVGIHRVIRYPAIRHGDELVCTLHAEHLANLAVEGSAAIVVHMRISQGNKGLFPGTRYGAVASVGNVTAHAAGEHVHFARMLKHGNSFAGKGRMQPAVLAADLFLYVQIIRCQRIAHHIAVIDADIEICLPGCRILHHIEITRLAALRPQTGIFHLIRAQQTLR